MGKFSPEIMDKVKWREKTVEAIRIDMDRNEGVIVGYAIPFFDPFEKDPEKAWSFTIRLAHSPEYMDEDQKQRLEAALRYVMMGVQKILNVRVEELKKLFEEESVEDFKVYGTFH